MKNKRDESGAARSRQPSIFSQMRILSFGLSVQVSLLFALSIPLIGQVSDTNKLRVVTSFLPIQSHTCAIAEEHAFVEQLLEKDSGPHDFQL
ncbi:MAG: hypothetical protein AAF546_13255, partial [Verrucomicrobiota bacterium]